MLNFLTERSPAINSLRVQNNNISQASRSVLAALLLLPWLSSCVSLFRGGPGDDIPTCNSGCMTGKEFISKTSRLSTRGREQVIRTQLTQGNIPGFLRDLQPVTTSMGRGSQRITGKFWVMPDYLALGTEEDFVRIPMNPITAQYIASRYGFVLPSKKMVDLIYRQAGIHLSPAPLKAGPAMTGNQYYRRHNAMISRQIPRGSYEHTLVAGHKKDVVVSNRLIRKPRSVAIYGWHRGNGRPIQPLSTVHGNTYADYSHGIRLVYRLMKVDGETREVRDVMADPILWRLLSDEGPLRVTAYNTRTLISAKEAAGTLARSP